MTCITSTRLHCSCWLCIIVMSVYALCSSLLLEFFQVFYLNYFFWMTAWLAHVWKGNMVGQFKECWQLQALLFQYLLDSTVAHLDFLQTLISSIFSISIFGCIYIDITTPMPKQFWAINQPRICSGNVFTDKFYVSCFHSTVLSDVHFCAFWCKSVYLPVFSRALLLAYSNYVKFLFS